MHADPISRRELTELVDCLTLLADDVGLKPREVECLITVRSGVWPIVGLHRDMWLPTVAQIRRIRLLVDVCVGAIALLGSDAKTWMRSRNGGLGVSPARYLLMAPEALPLLRDMLAAEMSQC